MSIYKRNNTIIVIVVAILLLFGSTLVYNFYFKEYGEYNKTDDKKESLYIDITDQNIINELLDTIKVNNLKSVAAFEKDVDNINTLQPLEKIDIAYNAIKKEEQLEIDVMELDNYFKNSFKTTIYYDKSDIFCVNGEVLYKFDLATNKYIYNSEHNCEEHNEINTIYTSVVSAKKKNDIYIIKVNYIWSNTNSSDTLYSSFNDISNNDNILFVIPSEDGNVGSEVINTFINENYDDIRDKLHEYTFVFVKEEDKYLLESFKYE